MKPAVFVLIPLAVGLAPPVFAQDSASEAGAANAPIVVTGQRIEDSLAALEACLERGCPPAEDIRLSLVHAENLFLGGDYKDGQQTLRGSIKRTKGAADELPEGVAGLYRASARFAEHLGEGKDFQLATLDMRETLERGLGKDHWRTLAADITVGDSRAKLGFPDEAEQIYKRTERRAIELGQNRVAMFARVRQALLLQARYDATKQSHWLREMIEILEQVRDDPLPGGEEFGVMAQVLLAKMDRKDGGSESTEALIRRFAESGGADRPVLLSSDPLYQNEDFDREAARASSVSARLSTASMNTPQWVDVGFWIDANGRVRDFEVLRSQGETGWVDQVERHVESRRYAPLAEEKALDGFYMIERYTMTARFASQTTGTRLRKREPVRRIERLDITPENYAREGNGEG